MNSISPGLTILLKPYRRSFYILRRGQTSPKQKLREPKRAEQKGAPVVVSRNPLTTAQYGYQYPRPKKDRNFHEAPVNVKG